MITLKDWMDGVNYRITEGSDYGWQCYGPNAYVLSFWDGDHNGRSTDVTFDTKTQVVYEASICDYANGRAYRLINPEFLAAHKSEADEKSCPVDEAWEDVNYIDLDVDEDFLEKLVAIVNGKEYDTRVMLQLKMTDEEELMLMRAAHIMDISVNEFVAQALQAAITKSKNGSAAL